MVTGSAAPMQSITSGRLQPKAIPGRAPDSLSLAAVPDNALPVGGGEPLSPPARSFFEPRFGHDFSRVRVFADSRSAEQARALHARAYTVGSNIVFGAGEYAPATDFGRRVLAHELTHVVQQSGAGPHLQRFEAPLHQSAELSSLTTGESKGFSLEEAQATYFGNWMRDMNQIFVPMIKKILGNDVVFAAINYLAMKKFGRTVTPEQFGYYIPAEHIDSPAGLVAEYDLLPRQPAIADSTPAQKRPASLDTKQESVVPGTAKVQEANLFAADETGVMAHIRRTNMHVERRLELAAQLGRNPDGLMSFGAALHAVEDLFAHSNWVEIATDKVLQANPKLVPQLKKSDRRVFTYSATVSTDKGMRPVLTTGSFTGKDTQMSVGTELVNLLRRPLVPPRSPAETSAEEHFTYELLKTLTGRLQSDPAFHAAIKKDVLDLLPGFPGREAIVDELLALPLHTIYFWTTLPPSVPKELKDFIGLTALQTAIRNTISSEILQPAANQIEASFVGAQVAQTSLVHSLDEGKRVAAGRFTPEETRKMQAVTGAGGPSVEAQQRDASAEAKARVVALQATPAQVVAGPSHTQLAKDHANSPFFGLSFLMATTADRKLRDRLIDAWNEARPGSGSKPHAFPGRPSDEGAMKKSSARGVAILSQGRELPEAAYDIAGMRRESAMHIRAVATALRAFAESPANAAHHVNQLRSKLGKYDLKSAANIDEILAGMALTLNKVQPVGDRTLALKPLATRLDEDADLIAAPGQSPTLAQRAEANAKLRAHQSEAAQILYKNPSVDATLAAIVLFTLSAEINTTAVAYEQQQRDIVEGKATLSGMAQQTISVEQLTLPSLSQRPEKLQALLQESRDIIAHPYEKTWWVPIVTDFIRQHQSQIAAEVEARNRGYALIYTPGTTGMVDDHQRE